MKYKALFIVFSLSLFGLPHTAEAGKARPPVQVMLHQKNMSEEETKITFTVVVNVETEVVSMSIVLSPEVVLIEGEESWEGALKAEAIQNIELLIQNPGDDGAVIEGRVSVRLLNGAVFVQKRRLVLNRSETKAPVPLPPLRQKGNNGAVLEFKGE